MVIIEVRAELWKGLCCETVAVTITKDGNKIFVDGEGTKMSFNGIQLRFEVRPGKIYCIFDGKSGSSDTIAKIHQKLT